MLPRVESDDESCLCDLSNTIEMKGNNGTYILLTVLLSTLCLAILIRVLILDTIINKLD